MQNDKTQTDRNDSEVRLETEVMRLLEDSKKLKELEGVIKELPNTPPGFSNDAIARIKWTTRWIKEHWSIHLEVKDLNIKMMQQLNEIGNLKAENTELKNRLENIIKAVGA